MRKEKKTVEAKGRKENEMVKLKRETETEREIVRDTERKKKTDSKRKTIIERQ